MNDFTKEELITLKNGVEYLSDRTSLSLQYIDKCNAIISKLISMLDNYCEHDWGVGFGSIYSPVIYCKKCYCQKPLVPDEAFNKLISMEH